MIGGRPPQRPSMSTWALRILCPQSLLSAALKLRRAYRICFNVVRCRTSCFQGCDKPVSWSHDCFGTLFHNLYLFLGFVTFGSLVLEGGKNRLKGGKRAVNYLDSSIFSGNSSPQFTSQLMQPKFLLCKATNETLQ